MISLDPRVGSKHLAPHFDALGIPYELTHLEFGDAAWLGESEGGPVPVGVEVKNIGDLVNSMTSGRLTGHQLPGLQDRYGVNVWLIVEGSYRQKIGSGLLEVQRGRGWETLSRGKRPTFTSDVENFLMTLEVQGGVHIRKTRSEAETASLIGLLHGWWQRPRHGSLKVVYRPPQLLRRQVDPVTAQIQKIASALPGVGYERSWSIADSFRSPAEMALAGESVWSAVDGVGKTGARRIVAAWHTEKAAA